MSTLLYKLFFLKKEIFMIKKHVMDFVTCFFGIFLNIGFFIYTCYNKKKKSYCERKGLQ